MLPSKHRIPRNEFPTPKRQGFRVFSDFFTGTIYFTTHLGVRASVVVSKKVAPHAVVRNTIKRRFYTALAGFMQNPSRGALVVLYPKKGSEKLSSLGVAKELQDVFIKAKINL